ncbi:hypothetical protein [Cellulomonas triticagri]|uniref:PH domain-containing protein n=1 Tax=Cellulomonas triticagri TaxID=2483352 RepID=A0A3M2JJN4_9CELL|nr:hypothetical protein [Cellulomonas triticagri]RMI13324.1 hypothetical protein EBM89_04785 [Cellulomonas triticagri]
MAVALVAVAPLAIAMALSDDPGDPRAVAVYATAPAVACLGVLIAVTRVRTRRRSTRGVRLSTPEEAPVPGLALPYRRDVAVLGALVGGYACALGVGLVLAGLLGVTRSGPSGAVVALGGVALVGATAPALLAVARGRLRRGVVVLTPERIIHRSWAFDLSGTWDQVIAVAPAGEGRPTVLVTMMRSARSDDPGRALVRTRTGPSAASRLAPHIAIEVSSVDLDPVLLLETVRFYASHPAARVELGTQDAVARVRQGDVIA